MMQDALKRRDLSEMLNLISCVRLCGAIKDIRLNNMIESGTRSYGPLVEGAGVRARVRNRKHGVHETIWVSRTFRM